MKLLLTSAGITNESLKKALLDLVGKEVSKTKIAIVPTASNMEEGDKDWLINDYQNLKKMGFEEIDIVDISALPKDIWEKRLSVVDIIAIEGGNDFYLRYWFKKSGFDENLKNGYLDTKVYLGISAGSCVTTPLIEHPYNILYGEDLPKGEMKIINEGLRLVDFLVLPHFNSKSFNKLTEENIREIAKNFSHKAYALDDNSGIKVTDGNIEIVTEGKYLELN